VQEDFWLPALRFGQLSNDQAPSWLIKGLPAVETNLDRVAH
jgi:hypothetical protein